MVPILQVSCDKKESFSVIGDPMKESYIRNNVRYFIKYEKGSSGLIGIDSIVLDDKGNLVSKFSLARFGTNFHFKYDSSGLLVEEKQISDILVRVGYKYGFDINNRTVEREEWFLNWSSGEEETFLGKRIYKYNDQLDLILQEVLFFDEDTTTLDYTYDNGLLTSVCYEVDFCESFTYNKGHLFRIEKTDPGVDEVNFFSSVTNLLDSSLVTKSGDTEVFIYNYFTSTGDRIN